MPYYLPKYVEVDGVQYVECRRCKELKLPTPENFAADKRMKDFYRPRTMCLECAAERRQIESDRAHRHFNRPGYIYFVELKVDSTHYPAGTIKIGFSSDVHGRVRALGYLYHSVNCIGVVKGVFKDEHDHHRMFSHLHLGREMFRPGDDLLAYIAEHAQDSDAQYTMVDWRDSA